MADPVADVRVWNGTAWVPFQPMASGETVEIHPLKTSLDGVSWWPVAEAGETAPSAPTSFTATTASKSQINLAWGAPSSPGDFSQYRLFRGASQIYAGTTRSFSDTGLASGTTYNYSVYGVTPGNKFGPGATASATTQLGQVQKKVILTATASASYNGAGNNRGVAEMYCGYYSGTNGLQKSLFSVAVPAEMRNCISVDKVEISVYSQHSYYNSGGRFGLAVHHNPSLGATFGGSTGIFAEFSAPKPGWMGGAQWHDITNYTCPGRTTVREEFRTQGANGFGLLAPNTSYTYYGYAHGATQTNKPQVAFTYTVAA